MRSNPSDPGSGLSSPNDERLRYERALEKARPRLGGLGSRFQFFPTIGSTNDAAASLAEGAVVVADQQTAGRGRRGHAWFSPPASGLYVSVVLAPRRATIDALRATQLLTLGAGVAISEALETAGGIVQALALLGASPFLLVNADIWCDYEFSGLRNHKLGSHLAHLVLVPNPPHHLKGDFSLDGATVGGGPGPRYTYAGIAVLSPEIVTGIRAGDKAPLGPVLVAAATRGEVTGELHQGVWRDIGTAERLAALQAMLGSTQ